MTVANYVFFQEDETSGFCTCGIQPGPFAACKTYLVPENFHLDTQPPIRNQFKPDHLQPVKQILFQKIENFHLFTQPPILNYKNGERQIVFLYNSLTFVAGDLKPSRGDWSWSNLGPHVTSCDQVRPAVTSY